MVRNVRGVLGTLVCWGGATDEQLEQFWEETSTADVIFGPGATAYLHEIVFHGKRLSDAGVSMRKALQPRVAPQPVRAEIAEIKRVEMHWLTEQIMGKEKPLYMRRLGL